MINSYQRKEKKGRNQRKRKKLTYNNWEEKSREKIGDED